MALLVGQTITGRDLEQATGSWSPERFASMCDALAWAASGRECPSLPSFTTRVNAKDGGIDAEWWIEIPDNGRAVPTPILGPGWNVFQYKKRDVMAEDRRRIISKLKSSLKGAADEVAKRSGRIPHRYVLFVNIDLKHNDKAAIKETLLTGYPERSKLHVEIVAAAELAALLNNHPHLRAAFFVPLAFKTWEETYQAHRRHKLFGENVDLIGREDELGRLKLLVDDPRVRVIVLSGPHDIGKSRLALEATQHRQHDVVLALDPRSMTLSDYRNLCSDRGEVLCIVEDPESDSMESLIYETLTLSNLKLVITLPTPVNAPAPAYGRDERVQSLHLQPLPEENARKLLKATGQPLDLELEDWIISHAGGIPGILLVATNIGNEIRSNQANFAEAIGQEFACRIRAELGPDALECARLFSTLTHVGISGAVESELRDICDLFGERWTPHRMLLSLAELEKAGLAMRGGSFAEVTPPILANYLAAQLRRGRPITDLFALYARLNEQGRIRLIKRLGQVRDKEIEPFWEAFFSADGPLRDFQVAISNKHLLKIVAATAPNQTLRLLKSGLWNSSREDRLAIKGDQRRGLMQALEQLLFRPETSREAVRLLWRLAEAENETYANNATKVLGECFYPLHLQMPLSLRERIELLREFTSEEKSKEGKLAAIKAAAGALNRTGWLQLHHSTGPELLGSMPICTYKEVYDYTRDLVDRLFLLAEGDDEVALAALAKLPGLTAKLGIQARPREALERFSKLVDWARSGKPGLDLSALFNALHFMGRALSQRLDDEELSSEYHEHMRELDQLRTDLEQADFSTRLKLWAGHWIYGEYKYEPRSGGHTRSESELMKLADEAIKNPNLLNEDLITWLLSPSAQKSNAFFYQLGLKDEGSIYRQRIERIGQQADGISTFAAYWIGWAKRDPEAAERRLDQLADLNAVTGEAIVQATGGLAANQSAVHRVEAQIQAGRVNPKHVARALTIRRWLAELSPDQFEQLLRAIAGKTLKYAAAVIEMLANIDRPLQDSLADFAWRCLEHDPRVGSYDSWDFDHLAAKLTQNDPERGFRLLERLLRRNNRDGNHWNPLDRYEGEEFWHSLYAQDSKHLMGLLLNAARTDLSPAWDLKDLIDQERDQDLMLDFATNDIEGARIVASCITSAKPGFWPLAFELIQMYPNDEALRNNLTSGIEQEGTVIVGPTSQFYEARRLEVERVLNDPNTPPNARAWLREIIDRLEREVSRQIVWDYDEDVNDLRRYIQDKNSAQRMWAIGRVLKYAPWEDIKRLLTVEDIAEALPQVDLPEKKRKMLETALKVWQYGK